MTYITKFSNVQITGDLNTTGNIQTTGNVNANSELIGNILQVGNLTIDSSNGQAITMTAGNSLIINGGNTLALGAENLLFGNIGNLHILGNLPSANGAPIFLSSDGNGTLSWAVPQGQGNAVVSGGTNSVQFNNGNGFGGDAANFAYTPNVGGSGIPALAINAFTTFSGANGGVNAASVNVALDVANLSIQGGSGGQILYTGGGGNVYFGNTPTGSPVGPNNAVQLNAGGNLLQGYANFSYDDSNLMLTLGGLEIDGNGLITLANTTVASNLVLPSIANVKLPGGSNNFVLKTDGTGNLSFEVSTYYNVSTISNATPFVPNTHVDDMICVPFAGSVSITLPSASDANVGAYFIIKDTWGGDRQASPITLSVNGGAQIDGQPTVQITGAYNSITVACTSNTAWGVI